MSSASRLKVGLWFLGLFASALACYPLLASLSQPGPELSDYVIEDFREASLLGPSGSCR